MQETCCNLFMFIWILDFSLFRLVRIEQWGSIRLALRLQLRKMLQFFQQNYSITIQFHTLSFHCHILHMPFLILLFLSFCFRVRFKTPHGHFLQFHPFLLWLFRFLLVNSGHQYESNRQHHKFWIEFSIVFLSCKKKQMSLWILGSIRLILFKFFQFISILHHFEKDDCFYCLFVIFYLFFWVLYCEI